MENKWKTPQSIITIMIILLIFVYIAIDSFSTKPKIKKDLNEVKVQYKELSTFLDKKIPEIDSTFVEHAKQINEQKEQIGELNKTFGDLK
jgi:hypothetical protein